MHSPVRKLKPALPKDVRLWCSDKFKKDHSVLHCILQKLVRGQKRWNSADPTLALVVEGEATEVSKNVSSKCAVLTVDEFSNSQKFWRVDHAKALLGMCSR